MSNLVQAPPSLHLDEVWKQRDSEDQLSTFKLFMHHANVAFIFLAKSPLTSILAIFSVATVLLILGLLGSVQRASLFGLNTAAGQLQMSVFVRDNCSDKEWEELDKYISSLPGVTKKRRLDKAAALLELEKILADTPVLLSGLADDNPLPASYEISFESGQGQALGSYAENLRSKPGVESVAYDGQLVRVLSNLGSKLKGAGRFSSIILIGLTLFLIASTIRISLYHESDEIEIMSLVGAYPNFIQAPFLIGGALQGLLGAIVACLALSLVENKILGTLRSDDLLRQASLNFSLLGFQDVIFLSILGIAAGVVGSYLASRRFG